jgi:hypothetical protein
MIVEGETVIDFEGQVAAPDPYTIPGSIFDEIIQVCQQVGIG